MKGVRVDPATRTARVGPGCTWGEVDHAAHAFGLAVPTGIITTDIAIAVRNKKPGHETCPGCGQEGHDRDAKFCKYCGSIL